MKRKIAWLVILAVALGMLSALPALAETTLASSKTPLTSANRAKRTNIELAAEAINGAIVYDAGGYFSFNDMVGPRTASYGYKNAINGRGVKVTGGGVGQVASTVYLALKKLRGIEFEECKTYGSKFTDDYVDSSKNAILVDYKAGTDFSFYNNGESSFRVDLWTTDEYLHCALVNPYEGTGEGEGYSSIWINGNAALQNNITLAADSIYDTSLMCGDVFSFNEVVGPRTARYGYESATNGRGVRTTGGGVAQVASAIWLAVKDMESVEVLAKTTYGKNYNQDYVDSANDAIAIDYEDDIDFRFRYNGAGTLSLYTYVNDDTLYCEAVES